MPALSNLKWKAFARAVVRGRPASHAYASTYHVTGNVAEVNASRLLRNAQVASRVAELKEQAARKAEKTTASLVEELDAAIIFARECKNPSAVAAAIALQARLLGLEAPQRLDVTRRPAPLPTNVLELSESEWEAQFSRPVKLVEPLPLRARLKRFGKQQRRLSARRQGAG